MTWRDRYQQGSWRDVKFFVDAAESVAGRRTVVHRFPARDVVEVEDVGREPGAFHLTCFVLGEEYDVDRDLLRLEFNKAGPGQLVHPYWGTFRAQVTSPVRIRETTGEGGMARFDLELVEITDSVLTLALPDLVPIVNAKAATALAASASSFQAVYTTAGAVQDTINSAVSAVGRVGSALSQVRSTVNSAIGAVNTITSAATSLIQDAEALAAAPAKLVAAVQSAVHSVLSAVTDVRNTSAVLVAAGAQEAAPTDGPVFDDYLAQHALTAVVALGSDLGFKPVKNLGSAQDLIKRQNQIALGQLYRTAALASGCQVMAALTFGSRDLALLTRDTLTGLLDEVLSSAPDPLWGALVDLRAALFDALSQSAGELPQLSTYTPPEPAPALVLAFDLYGDAARDAELIFRNDLLNPAVVPGGAPLEVANV